MLKRPHVRPNKKSEHHLLQSIIPAVRCFVLLLEAQGEAQVPGSNDEFKLNAKKNIIYGLENGEKK